MVEKTLSNVEIVTLAVYLLGGDTQYIDTEDIAIKANQLTPGRFCWQKYPDQVNIENVRKRLSDALKKEKGEYITGSTRKGWKLTEIGVKITAKLSKSLIDLSTEQSANDDMSWYQKEKSRLLANPIYKKFKSLGDKSITIQEAEAFFRIDDYITGNARSRKLAKIINIFRNDLELGEAVQKIAKKVPSK
jgi:hypothetical protein